MKMGTTSAALNSLGKVEVSIAIFIHYLTGLHKYSATSYSILGAIIILGTRGCTHWLFNSNLVRCTTFYHIITYPVTTFIQIILPDIILTDKSQFATVISNINKILI